MQHTEENGNVRDLTEKEILKTALDHMAEALCFAFELQTPEGEAVAFMLDSVVKYAQVVYHGDSPKDASCDYTQYEQMVYQRKLDSQSIS